VGKVKFSEPIPLDPPSLGDLCREGGMILRGGWSSFGKLRTGSLATHSQDYWKRIIEYFKKEREKYLTENPVKSIDK
jgi:hypothetical protein